LNCIEIALHNLTFRTPCFMRCFDILVTYTQNLSSATCCNTFRTQEARADVERNCRFLIFSCHRTGMVPAIYRKRQVYIGNAAKMWKRIWALNATMLCCLDGLCTQQRMFYVNAMKFTACMGYIMIRVPRVSDQSTNEKAGESTNNECLKKHPSCVQRSVPIILSKSRCERFRYEYTSLTNGCTCATSSSPSLS
jgi:hypothetical protein